MLFSLSSSTWKIYILFECLENTIYIFQQDGTDFTPLFLDLSSIIKLIQLTYLVTHLHFCLQPHFHFRFDLLLHFAFHILFFSFLRKLYIFVLHCQVLPRNLAKLPILGTIDRWIGAILDFIICYVIIFILLNFFLNIIL